jgi:hypothetical protein
VTEPTIERLRREFIAAAAVISAITVGAGVVHFLFGVM